MKYFQNSRYGIVGAMISVMTFSFLPAVSQKTAASPDTNKNATSTAKADSLVDLFSLLGEDTSYPSARTLGKVPMPATFRSAFDRMIAPTLDRLKAIEYDLASEEEETGSYRRVSEILPGTTHNRFEFVAFALLMEFYVDYHIEIDSSLNERTARQEADVWKSMLKEAFPEDVASIKTQTDTSGNSFFTITHKKTSAEQYKPDGWKLTLQNTAYEKTRRLDFVLSVYKRE